jgi:hypothetical protein
MFMTMVTMALGLTVGMALLTASSALWRSRRRLLPWLHWPHGHRVDAKAYPTSSYLRYPDHPLPVGQNLIIPEYDAELAPSEDLSGDPAFWFAHLVLTLGDLTDTDPEEYGVAASTFDTMLDRLGGHFQPWPVFRVPFGGGHTILVIYSHFDAYEIEYVVRHPDWGRLGFLGDFGPEPRGPGLSWTELTAIAEARPSDGAAEAGLSDPAHRLLLLLPMLGDAATPADASTVVAQALVRCGMSADVAPRFAAELIGSDMSGKPSWSAGPDNPVPVCSWHNSPRQVPIALGISPDQAQALADALRGAG